MQSDWQIFITEQGAIIEEGVVRHFGDFNAELTATRDRTVLCDLSQFSLLRVSGPDAESFLQNLLSNDIREVSNGRAQYSSFNTAKGRMLASFLIWRDGEDYLLQLPVTLAESVRKKLSMYVLRAKVKITDVSNEMISLGLSGRQNLLSATELLTVHDLMDARVISLGESRFQFNIPANQATALWQQLSTLAKPAGSACWDWLNVRAGIPVIQPETQEQFVPQMANFDLIGGINFKKGCYPGQEIVARMHYLGKLKRRMYLAHVDAVARAGEDVYSASLGEQACGMLANAVPSPAGGYDVLVVMQIESHDTQIIHLGAVQGAVLNFEKLPYPLP